MRNKWTGEELNFIRENYKFISDKEISDKLGTHTEASVMTKRKKMGLIRQKLKHSFDDVIKAFSKTEYELVSDETDFKDTATNSLKYICPKHRDKGVQTISLGHLESGRGCYWCGREITENAHRTGLLDEKLEVDKQVCKNKGFQYVDTKIINGKAHIGFICNEHKNIGIQYVPRGNVYRESMVGCRYCLDKKKFKFSKGEKMIRLYLENHEIDYISQYIFKDCKDKSYLPFDFYLPDNNTIVEYDGEHHYMPVTFNGISTEKAIEHHEITKLHDKIKDQYCKKNNIKIIRIPYWDRKNINCILDKELCS